MVTPHWETFNQTSQEGAPLARLDTGFEELNRVWGGGLVADSFTLLGGDPGVGKSTLLLQLAGGLLKKNPPSLRILYVSGEESINQIRGRAQRLGVTKSDQLAFLSETRLESALAVVTDFQPQIIIMDSLQTFATDEVETAAGSVSQVREIAARLMNLAKTQKTAVVLVGHVTKEGAIAGPKLVEHLVDTVLYFEGDSTLNYRLLRTVKNRFGSTHELGVFEMSADGLKEVTNPSALFLNDRQMSAMGTAICCSLEGSRPLFVEMQALVSSSPLAMPRRTSVGFDSARISLLAAILERHLELRLSQHDIYFNVAGGLRISEPACDLAACAAVWSSTLGRALPHNCAFMGELGLTGEIRRISAPEIRIEEARKLGFEMVILAKGSFEKLPAIKGIKIHPIGKIQELPKFF